MHVVSSWIVRTVLLGAGADQLDPNDVSPWIVSLVLMMLVGGLGGLFEILRRRFTAVPQVAFEPRRPVPWTALELSLIVAGYLVLQTAAASVVFGLAGLDMKNAASGEAEFQEIDPEQYTARLLATVLGNVLTAAATLALLRSNVTLGQRLTRGGLSTRRQPRSGATWSDLGLSRPTPRDMGLGLAAFAAALIPIYGLQAVLTQFTQQRHPIVEMLGEHPNFGLFAVSVLAAVVVAPFVEELFFRVALQGWLERVQWLATSDSGAPLAPESESSAPLEPQPMISDRLMPWPILLSSLAFALAHLGNGLDPISLFFLALVLGYLYQRTHRLWPSIVVHFTLNSCGMLVLWLQTAYG